MIDKTSELHRLARKSAKIWDRHAKSVNLSQMMKDGYVRVCPECASRLIWTPEWISEFNESFYDDPKTHQEEYWIRVGWCEGLGFNMGSRVIGGDDYVCDECSGVQDYLDEDDLF